MRPVTVITVFTENNPSSGGDEQPEEEMPELVRSPMYFVFDEESILLFEHAFSFRPLHDFRFFREETGLSIDTIYVSNVDDQLEVQKSENVFFLYPQKDHEVCNLDPSLNFSVYSFQCAFKWRFKKPYDENFLDITYKFIITKMTINWKFVSAVTNSW